jgi:hypothetical protein
MDTVLGDSLKPSCIARAGESSIERPHFQVFPILVVQFALEVPSQKLSFFPSAKRFAMIGERQRNHTCAGKPATDSAKEQSVCQFTRRRRRGKGYRLITIGLLQGLEPRCGVKDRSLGMAFDKGPPPGIFQRV